MRPDLVLFSPSPPLSPIVAYSTPSLPTQPHRFLLSPIVSYSAPSFPTQPHRFLLSPIVAWLMDTAVQMVFLRWMILTRFYSPKQIIFLKNNSDHQVLPFFKTAGASTAFRITTSYNKVFVFCLCFPSTPTSLSSF